MLIGRCPKCGGIYSGWGLQSPWHQVCGRCGIDIDIMDNESNIVTARSSYRAEEPDPNQPYNETEQDIEL